MSRLVALLPLALVSVGWAAPAPALAPAAPPQQPARAPGYDQPAQNILDVLHAPSPPQPNVSPTGDTIMLMSYVEYAPLARIAEPYLRLAGVRVEPRTRRKRDTPGGYGVNPCLRELSLVTIATTAEVRVALPAGCVEAPAWAPDGKRFTMRVTTADAVELWLGTAATGAVHRLGDARLNPMLGQSTVQWMPDGKQLLVKLVPPAAGPPPPAQLMADSPSIQESLGGSGESSTYETRDTLTNKHDEDLFDYYAQAQLGLVDADTGRVTPVGKPAIFDEVDASPDGQHILVQAIHKPYSYVTTYDRFPREVEIWDRAGRMTTKLASVPLADRVPVAGVRTGPRDWGWRSTAPATLLWAEALDKGDWHVTVPARDKVMMQSAPFTAAPVEVLRTEQRVTGMLWGEQPATALLTEYDENRHWNRTFVVDVDHPAAKPKLLFDLSSDEKYKAPGQPVMRVRPDGQWVMRQPADGRAIYLRGAGASPDGDHPFLDKLELASGKSERLFHCAPDAYDWFLAFTEPTSDRAFVTWHQSPTEPPNAFLRSAGGADAPTAATAGKQLTRVADPAPIVRQIKKRLVRYKRKDGLDLSFTLYTPPGYVEGTRVPAILYAYPLDYADPKAAGQVTGSEYTFSRLQQYRLLLLAGYAIIDNASFPIIGDPKRAYDHYLEQLVDDAAAAVDKAVALGVVDRDRVGVTGHSHGALMTVNLLAHSKLFKAGVASSGSYNKTLTPFGFQSERRSVWAAPDVYLKASPFFSADTLKLPLLIVHGAEDANPGTTALQATKLYEALRGNGGTTRLVMLPHEPHWYSAMESNEQFAYELVRWFDTYVKNAAKDGDAKNPAAVQHQR